MTGPELANAVHVVLVGLGALILLNWVIFGGYVLLHSLYYVTRRWWEQVHMREYHNFYKNNPTVAPSTNNKQAEEKD